MKTYINAILALAMTLGMASCSKDSDEADDEKEKTEKKSEFITEEYCFVPKTAEEKAEAKEYAKQKKAAEKWEARAENVMDYFNQKYYKAMRPFMEADSSPMTTEMQEKAQKAQTEFIEKYGPAVVEKGNKIEEGFKKECPDIQPVGNLAQLFQFKKQLEQMLNLPEPATEAAPAEATPAEEAVAAE